MTSFTYSLTAPNLYVVFQLRLTSGHIFDSFRSGADALLATLCPEAISKLGHAVERAASGKPEDWPDAALACRRVLKDLADRLYPARDDLADGRRVGEAEYKNRLWAFAKAHGGRAVEGQSLALTEIDGLCGTLDRMYELATKGVHADISREEAEMCVLRTYVLAAQLSRLATVSGTSDSEVRGTP